MSRHRLAVRGLAAAAAAGLAACAVLAFVPGGTTLLSVSRVVFLLVLFIELILLDVTASSPRAAPYTRILLFLFPLMVTLSLRGYQALGTRGILEWDETYYTSIAATAARGDGVYPYVVGFGPMHAMGGVGYLAYTYAVAVKLFGPTILGLRSVSLLVSVAGLAGIWVLIRMWYGSGTAWMAAALTSASSLFVASNSVRMDAWAFAYVAWALVVLAMAFKRWDDRRWHFLAGLVFALGLQAHIDTAVTALAAGGLYLAIWLRDVTGKRRVTLPTQMLFYVAGCWAGLVIYLCLNVLPDSTAFYRTAVLIRVDTTTWYSRGTSSLLASFLDPRILVAKELARYEQLIEIVPVVEILLFVGAVLAMAFRRNGADRLALVLFAGVIVASASVLNSATPLYYIHVMPALLVPLAPLFTQGLSGQSPVSTRQLGTGSLLAFAVTFSALCAVNNARPAWRASPHPAENGASTETIERVRARADRNCRIAGDGSLYVRYFADYPYFISSRATEMKYAMLYFGTTDPAAYWSIKQPDVVFGTEPLPAGLASYIVNDRLSQIEPGIWIRREGCQAGR